MRQARCSVCGRDHTRPAATNQYGGVTVAFDDSICDLCGVTLSRALAGIVELLKQSHGEKRERVLDRLVGKLNEQGFEITSFPRRHA